MGLREKYRFLTAGKNYAFEGLVSVSLILVFILVVVTGVLSFVRLNGVIHSVNRAIHPNKLLDEAKDIYENLVRADNMVKSYLLTRDEKDMAVYSELITATWAKMKSLEKLAGNDRALGAVVDTLDVLVDEKFNILDMFVIINGQYPEELSGLQEDGPGKGPDGTEQALKEQELELTRRDKIIMEQARLLIDNLESGQVSILEFNTREAEEQASSVKRIIISFGAATLMLLILTGSLIYLYIHRNNEYRAILAKARNDAEALARERQQFLANMSHEIKTPMNIIAGYLGQILDNPLPEPHRGQLMIVKRSSDHLLELLGNLLDLSKLQADKLELVETEFSPEEIIRDMKNWFAPSAEEKSLALSMHIHPDVPEFVRGDAVRLRQILFNLAGNAVKFTDNGGITLRLFKVEDRGDMTVLAFEVSDTGIGIPPEDMDKIFTEFGQGAGESALKSKGTGLGLPISSRLVTLMGGKLKVESSPGKGSVFTVEIPFIPVKRSGGSGHAEPPSAKGIPAGLKVLVVDDEAYNRGLLKLILGKYGCILFEAGKGEEAVILAREQDPDLILMDIRMPGMNGLEAAKAIRHAAAGRGIRVPIIAISAAMSPEDIAEYRNSGMDDFISKPFEEDKLLKAILRLIKTPGSEAPGTPARKAVYSLDALREGSGGNTGFVREMGHLFLKNTESGLTELEGLLDSGSAQQLADMVHKISAPVRHLRAEPLYSALREIQRQHVEGNLPGAVSALAEARAEFDRIRTDLLSQPEFIPE